MKTSSRIEWVEWTRGVAALLVVFNHFVPWASHAEAVFIDIGRVGVVAFFLVSGFVVPLSYRRQSTRVFLVRRFTRLYPAYWLVLAVIVFSAPRMWGEPTWWISLLSNASMIQGLFGAALLGVSWTLAIELVFYAQQVFFKRFNALDVSWRLGFAWASIFVLAIFAERFLFIELPISFAALLATACVGHVLCLAHIRVVSLKVALWFSGFVVGCISLFSLFRAPGIDSNWPGPLYAGSYLGGIGLFTIMFLLRNKHWMVWASWFAGISYALYLVHPLFYWVLGDEHSLVPVMIALSLAIGAAWLLHKFVELPFVRLGRKYRDHENPKSIN